MTVATPDRLEDAMLDIGAAIGGDLAYFAPPTERHFDAAVVADAVGGALLSVFVEHVAAAFAKGAVDRLRHHIERLGGWTVDKLRDRIAQLYTSADENEAYERARKGVSAAASAASPFIGDATIEQASETAAASRAALQAELRAYGLSQLRAGRIAQQVSEEGLQLLFPG